ncbi:MAG: ferrous iron transport protein A [Eggerthellaceae bacterium]|nr:ferrous iron transport protein A [Eggerthellaceae bacterium]
MKTLEDIKPGQESEVIKLNGQGTLRRHIMDMGITKGVRIFVRRVAPLGDPIEITVRGYELSLRKEEARSILVK